MKNLNSGLIKLVEKGIANPDSVSYEELEEAVSITRSALSAAEAACFAVNYHFDGNWAEAAKYHLAKYHELTNKDKD